MELALAADCDRMTGKPEVVPRPKSLRGDYLREARFRFADDLSMMQN